VPRKAVAKQIDKLAWINDQIKKYQAETILLDEIIAKGAQIKSTATGFPSLDYRTCSCGTYADRRAGHSESCTIEAVTDPMPIVAAMKESRLAAAQIAELLSLRDELSRPADESEAIESATSWINSVAAENQRLLATVAELRDQVRALEGSAPVEVVTSAAERDAQAVWQAANRNGMH
jgi:hypothetical protein